jgi:hypothetical protein
MRLTAELAQFIESGTSITMSCSNRRGQSDLLRAIGARIGGDQSTVTLFLSAPHARQILANLTDNPRVAAAFSRIVDLKTLQLKGDFIEAFAASEADREWIRNYVVAFSEQLYLTGMPKSVIQRMNREPAIGITFRVTDLFEQTPGPGTGNRVAAQEVGSALR